MRKSADKLNKIRTPYIQANPRQCKACWECVNVCPKQIIGKIGFLWHKHVIIQNGEACLDCQKCMKVCPHGVFSKR